MIFQLSNQTPLLVVRSGSGHWPLSRPVISTEQSKGQMQSVEIPLYQTGKQRSHDCNRRRDLRGAHTRRQLEPIQAAP
eukprot:COSAG02_NODE_719_length_18061_cov_31.886594_7_plen_78_part_00